jgi:hypothetical protein
MFSISMSQNKFEFNILNVTNSKHLLDTKQTTTYEYTVENNNCNLNSANENVSSSAELLAVGVKSDCLLVMDILHQEQIRYSLANLWGVVIVSAGVPVLILNNTSVKDATRVGFIDLSKFRNRYYSSNTLFKTSLITVVGLGIGFWCVKSFSNIFK